MKALRLFAALFVAFGSLLFATPALAEDPVTPTVVVVTTPGGDDSSYQIPLTTTVTFDGVTYGSVYATTNSVITFGQPDGTYWTYPQTPSISLYSMDWVVFPDRGDEHLIIAASDGGFQVDISARPYGMWDYQSITPTNINIVAAINTDGTVAISYSLTGPSYEGQTRTGVRLTNGSIVTLEEYGIVQVEQPPVLAPVPVDPTPTPTPTVEPTPEPTPTVDPTPEPTPTVEPTPEPTTPAVVPPTVPEGAALISEGSSIQVVAPAGQRIVSVSAWYGDPNDSTRGVDVSSTITQLASGQTEVTIDSSNVYGDPAPGTVKTLIYIVVYENIPGWVNPDTTTPVPTDPPSNPEPTPTQEPAPTSTPTPSTTPQPEPTASTSPEPSVPETPTPTPSPTVEPLPQPDPSPSPTPGPVPVPPSSGDTGNPQPEPSVTPSPIPTLEPEPTQPTPEPTLEPTPEPSATVDPSPKPSQPLVEPIKEPDPIVVVEPDVPVVKPVSSEPTLSENPTVAETVAVMDELTTIAPEKLTDAQVELLVAAAEATFLVAEPGSPAYEQALDALMVAAQADDPELPAELAAIPGAAQVLEAFNALGNIGADMSPKQREQTKKEAIALVAVGQVAAASAAAAASAGSASNKRKP